MLTLSAVLCLVVPPQGCWGLPPISPGEPVAAEWTANDPLREGAGRERCFRYFAPWELELAVTARSDEGIPLVVRVVDLKGRVVVEPAASGAESECVVACKVAAGTLLVIEVDAAEPDDLGAFEVELRETPDFETHSAKRTLFLPPATSDALLATLAELRTTVTKSAAGGADPAAARSALKAVMERLAAAPGAAGDTAAADFAIKLVPLAADLGDPALAVTAAEFGRDLYERSCREDARELLGARTLLANALSDQGARARARKLFETTLPLVERFRPDDETMLFSARRGLALVLAIVGEPADAKPLLEAAIATRQAHAKPDDLTVAVLQQSLAFCLRLLGDYEESRRLYERVLAVQEKSLPHDDFQLLWTIQGLASALIELGELARARDLLVDVVAVRERTLPEGHFALQWARLSLGRALAPLGEHERARELLQRVVTTWEKTLADDDGNLIEARGALAMALFDLGQLDAARRLQEKNLEQRMRTHPNDHPRVLDVKNALAITLFMCGEWERARTLREEVLRGQTRLHPPDHPLVRGAQTNLALTLADLGENAAARALQERVLASLERTRPNDGLEVQAARSNLAITLGHLGDLQAKQVLEETVLHVLERSLPADHPRLVSAQHNLAGTLADRHQFAAAKELQQKVLAARERTLPRGHPWALAARSRLATTLLELGELDAAVRLTDQNLAIYAEGRVPAGDRRRLQEEFHRVEALRLAGKDEAARAALTELRKSAERSGEAVGVERGIERSLAALAARTGDPVALRGELERIEAGVRRGLAAGVSLSPRELAAQLTNRATELNLLLRLAPLAESPELDRRVFELTETVRAMAAGDRSPGAAADDDEEIRSLRREAAVARRRLNDMVTSSVDATRQVVAAPEAIAEAARLRDQAERRIDGLLRQRGLRPVSIECTALAAALPPGSAAVGFRRCRAARADESEEKPADAGERILAHVFRKDGTLVRVDLGPAAPIEEAVRAWRAAIGKPVDRGAGAVASGPDERVLGERLRALVFDPVVAAAPGATRFHVCLEETLHLVPLDALPIGTGVVGDRIELRFETSFARLVAPPARPTADASLLAFGGIDFDAGATARPDAVAAVRSGPAGLAFVPLRETRYEVEALADLYEKTFGQAATMKLKQEATKQAFHDGAPHARFVHLATHGYFADPGLPSQEEEGAGDQRRTSLGNEAVMGLAPLALCGVALAGANRGRDELGSVTGILTGEELAGVDLRGCELAVLSACDTNVGVTRSGQGVQSLEAALHAAGARTSVTSLWKVDDEATRTLMLDFYRRMWVEKAAKAQALWQAKQALRARGAPLRDWAGWRLTGDPE